MRKVLVTGGAGFIGSHLVEALLARGWGVRVLDDISTGKLSNLAAVNDSIEFVKGSVVDRAAVQKAIEGTEVVFHLAAIPSVKRSVEDPLESHEVIATGTLNILEEARHAGVRRVIYAGSSSAYGNLPGSIASETAPISPLSPYAAAKLAGELYCQCFAAVYQLETVRLRFFNVYGPRQDPSSPYSGVIALFMTAMNAGRVPRIDGDGLQSRDFFYVANAVNAIIKAADASAAVGNVYNIGNGSSITILDLVKELNQLFGKAIQPSFGPPRPGDVRLSQADISSARQDLGYEPLVSFREGLKLTLDSFRSP